MALVRLAEEIKRGDRFTDGTRTGTVSGGGWRDLWDLALDNGPLQTNCRLRKDCWKRLPRKDQKTLVPGDVLEVVANEKICLEQIFGRDELWKAGDLVLVLERKSDHSSGVWLRNMRTTCEAYFDEQPHISTRCWLLLPPERVARMAGQSTAIPNPNGLKYGEAQMNFARSPELEALRTKIRDRLGIEIQDDGADAVRLVKGPGVALTGTIDIWGNGQDAFIGNMPNVALPWSPFDRNANPLPPDSDLVARSQPPPAAPKQPEYKRGARKLSIDK